MLEATHDLRSVQRMLGHADPGLTANLYGAGARPRHAEALESWQSYDQGRRRRRIREQLAEMIRVGRLPCSRREVACAQLCSCCSRPLSETRIRSASISFATTRARSRSRSPRAAPACRRGSSAGIGECRA